MSRNFGVLASVVDKGESREDRGSNKENDCVIQTESNTPVAKRAWATQASGSCKSSANCQSGSTAGLSYSSIVSKHAHKQQQMQQPMRVHMRSVVVDERRKEQPRLVQPLVWIDLEMTGLELEKDTIIEIACLVSDGQLNTIIEGPNIAIHHTDDVLENMNDWSLQHHGESGLTQRSRDSNISMQQAEEQVLAFVRTHIPQPQSAPLAGNSVHVDKLFLMKYMPRLHDYLHYRILDVSTIKELCRRWYPVAFKRTPRKKLAHTAMSDIRESVQELKYYEAHIFKSRQAPT